MSLELRKESNISTDKNIIYEIEWDDSWNHTWNDWSSHCTSIISFDDSWCKQYKEEEKNLEEELSKEREKILKFNLLDDMGDDDLDEIGGFMLEKFTNELPEEYLREKEKKEK